MLRSVSLVVSVLVGLFIPVCAFAYPVPSGLEPSKYGAVCPPRPPDAAEGASSTEVLLTTIAQEQADACYRREQLAHEQHIDLQTLHEDLAGTLKTALQGEPTVKVGNWTESPAPSSAVTVSSFGTKAEAELDGNTETLEVALLLMFGAGLGVAIVMIWRHEVKIK